MGNLRLFAWAAHQFWEEAVSDQPNRHSEEHPVAAKPRTKVEKQTKSTLRRSAAGETVDPVSTLGVLDGPMKSVVRLALLKRLQA